MKRILLLFVVLTFLLVPRVMADCEAVTLPYVENFDDASYTAGSSITSSTPNCWVMPRYHTSATGTLYYPYIYNSATYASSGARSLYFGQTSAYVKDSLFYFALPAMDAEISTLQLSFSLRCGTASYATDSLLVGVMTDPKDTTTFTFVKAVYLTGSNTHTEYVVPLDSYTGSGKYIAVARPRGLAHYYYIDDVTVKKIPSCFPPKNLATSGITSTSVKLSWQQNPMALTAATNWDVAVLEKGGDITSATPVAVAATSYTFTGLQPETEYDLYVRVNCGDEQSEWVSASVTTYCAAKAVPYLANFDSDATGTGKRPDCWLGYYSTNNNYPYVYATAKKGTSGNGLYFYATAALSSYAILPTFDTDLNKLMLTFDYKGTAATARSMVIGIAENIGSMDEIETSMVVIDTINIASTDWATKSISFDTYTGNGLYIVMKALKAAIYVDNVEVGKIPSCYSPIQLNVSNITINSMDLSWQRNETEPTPSTKWDVKVGADGTIQSVDTPYIHLTGLTHTTDYTLYVRTNCGADGYSDWASVNATTAYLVSLPNAHWDFDDPDEAYQIGTTATYIIPKGWSAANGGTTSSAYIPYLVKNTTTIAYSQSGDYALRIYSSNSSTTHNVPAYAVLPAIDADLDTLQVRFDVRSIYNNLTTGALTKTNEGSTYAHAIKIGSIVDPTDPNTIQFLGEYVVPLTSSIGGTASNISDDPEGKDFWHSVTFPLTGATGNYIVFYSDYTNGTSTYYNYAYIDNLVVEAQPQGAAPAQLVVVESLIGNDTAVVEWESNASSWKVDVTDNNGSVFTQVVTSKSVVVRNLVGNTAYTVTVTTLKSDGTDGFSASTSFRTQCSAYSSTTLFDFDDATNKTRTRLSTSDTYVIDYCWVAEHKTATSASYFPYTQANTATYAYSYSGTYALRLNGTSTYPTSWAAMPAINADLDELQVVFKARPYYHNINTGALTYNTTTYKKAVKVGRMTDPNDFSTFQEIIDYQFKTVETGTTATEENDYLWETITVPLKGAKGNYIAFVTDYASSNYVYIDDIYLDVAPSCTQPTAVADSINTDSSLVIKWNASGASFYTKLMEGTKVIAEGVSTEQYIEYKNLSPVTDYTFYVATKCDDLTTDTTIVKFQTACPDAYPLPYKEGFDGYASGTGNRPQCWQGYYTTTNTYPYVYSTAAKTGDRGFYLANTQVNPSYAVLPTLAGDINKLMISFDYKANAITATTAPTRTMVIGVAANVGSIEEIENSFVALDTIVATSTTWEFYQHALNKYSGSGKHIVLKGWNGNGAASGTTATAGGLYIDNLVIDNVPTCVSPINVVATAKATTITLSWERSSIEQTPSTAWDVKLGAEGAIKTVNELKAVFADLTPKTTYQIYYRTNCGTEGFADWDSVKVTTKCLVDYDNTTAWNFEDNLVATTNATYSIPECWEVGTFGTTTQSYAPYAVANTTTYNYAHGTEATTGKALRFYTTASYGPAYAVLPESKASITKMNLTFWGRAAYNYTSTYSTAASQNRLFANSSYGKELYIGVVTDPFDINTVTLLDTITYPHTFTSSPYSYTTDDETGNNYWVKYTVNLKNYTGGQLVLVYPKGTATSYFYIDDMQFEDACKDTTVNISALVQAGQTYAFGDKLLDKSGVYTDTLQGYYGCDSVVVLNLTVCEPISKVLNITLQNGETYQFAGQTLTETGVYTDSLVNAQGCDSIVTLNLLVCQPLAETLNVTVQAGETYQFGGQTLSETGVYTDSLQNALGCDSIVTLNLLVCQPITTTIDTLVQYGETYNFAGQTLDVSGRYFDTLQTAQGCDSVVVLNLTVCGSISLPIDETIQYGESYLFGGEELTESGVYYDTVTTSTGCNSVFILNLYVCEQIITPIKAVVQAGESYTLNHKTYTESGLYYDTLRNAQGCDSVLALDLLVCKPIVTTQDVVVQAGETYQFAGKTLAASGVYTDSLQNAQGCDSIVVLNLTVCEPINVEISRKVNADENWTFNGRKLTKSGVYVDTLVNAQGCDSIITLNFTYCEPKSELFEVLVQNGESYEFGGQTLTASGVYYDIAQTAEGCDSLNILSLTVCSKMETTFDVVIQAGETYQFVGQTLSQSGVYVDSARTAQGCDSITILNLTVCQPIQTVVDVLLQAGESYPFADTLLTTTGKYQYTFQNATGCDSTVIVNVTACEPIATTLNVLLQAGETYQFAGQTLSESGVYTDTLQNAQGCDSIVVLNLSVCQPLATTLNAVVQAGETYQFAGQTLNASGVYIDTLVNAQGCDSVVTLNLIVCQPIVNTLDVQIEAGSIYRFGKQSLYLAGTYTDTLVNAQGCDSIVVLNLAVCLPRRVNYAVTIQAGQSYEFGNQQLTEAGVYVDTLVSAQGCDSIVTLNLTICQPTQSAYSASIREGETYQFGSQELTAAGVYTDTLVNAQGCDSVVTLTLVLDTSFVCETLYDTIVAVIDSGEYYTFAGIDLYQSGLYVDSALTAEGCDLITVLALVVCDPVVETISATINAGDVYEFAGIELTQAGTYTDTLVTDEGCKVVVELTLDVNTGLINNGTFGLQIAPNPVRKGQIIIILSDNDFTGAQAEIYDTNGKLVNRETLNGNQISGINIEGIYMIRVQQNDNQYQSKIVVK